jgi:hypothetical protein
VFVVSPSTANGDDEYLQLAQKVEANIFSLNKNGECVLGCPITANVLQGLA